MFVEVSRSVIEFSLRSSRQFSPNHRAKAYSQTLYKHYKMANLTINNKTNRTFVTCPIVPAEKIEIKTLVCPSVLEPGDELELVLSPNEDEPQEVLATFKVPPPQKGAGLTSTRTESNNGFELIIDYRRKRVHSSRSPNDEEWDRCAGRIHIRNTPVTLLAVIAKAEHQHRVNVLMAKKAALGAEIDSKKREEMKLQLALVDIRSAIAEMRREVIEVDKALITEVGDHAMQGT